MFQKKVIIFCIFRIIPLILLLNLKQTNMKKISIFVLTFVALFLITTTVQAQKWLPTTTKGQKQTVQKAVHFDVSKPLTEMKDPGLAHIEKGEREIKNYFLYKLMYHAKNKKDEVSQSAYSIQTKANASIGVSANGAANTDNSSLVAPPDVTGDVGPNNYVQCVNNVTIIFDKNGNKIWGPQPTSVFWDGFNGSWTGTNDGDPIVLYDQAADRWVITQFAVSSSDGTQWELIAVSTSGDPTGSYYRYAYQFDNMPDYPKLGVWSDAYYLSANAFASSLLGTYAAALERDKMLTGDPNARMVLFFNDWTATGTYSMLPADADGVLPAVGTPNYYVYDTDNDTYWSADALKVWQFHVDWNNTSNSYFSLNTSLIPASFSSNFSSDVPQPSHRQKLDLLNDRMMFRAQFRHFSDHNTIVVSRTVNDGGVAAVRWYELRNSGSIWSIYQQGTFNLGDGAWRWMPSIAMNGDGDIAIGYSVSSKSIAPAIRVTGRHASDPLGLMTISETSLYDAGTSQVGASRWGDYTTMSVDPNDDNTFWYTNEYSDGSWYWRTRINSFTLGSGATCVAPAITAQPQNVTTDEGTNAVFGVTATGTSLAYQWEKDGVNISGATSSSLTLNSVSSTDEGQYSCVVSNSCGTVTSNSATLTVTTSTACITINSQPSSTTVNSGKTASFSVSASGTGLTYKWYKEGTPLSDNGHYVGTLTPNFSIDNTQITDAGDYYCVISASCGTAQTNTANLGVKYRGTIYTTQLTSFVQTNVYPNPFDNILNVAIDSRILPVQLVIVDLSGKTIYNSNIEQQENNIDLTKFVSGTYLVKIIDKNNNTQEFKVTKQ